MALDGYGNEVKAHGGWKVYTSKPDETFFEEPPLPQAPRTIKAEDALRQAITLISGDRHEQHGDRHKNFGHAAKLISAYLGIDVSPSQVAWVMVLMKMARDHNGTRSPDNSVDAAGYCGLAGELSDGC